MAALRPTFCELQTRKSFKKRESAIQRTRTADSSSESVKILLQPRLCTLRSYGSDRDGAIKTRRDADVSPFFVSLADYIDSSRKSQDFETISGRLAMRGKVDS